MTLIPGVTDASASALYANASAGSFLRRHIRWQEPKEGPDGEIVLKGDYKRSGHYDDEAQAFPNREGVTDQTVMRNVREIIGYKDEKVKDVDPHSRLKAASCYGTEHPLASKGDAVGFLELRSRADIEKMAQVVDFPGADRYKKGAGVGAG